MCTFLTAIVVRNDSGFFDVHTKPEHTDSHEDLIDLLDIDDTSELGRRKFCRVEFISSDGNYANADSYELIIDDPTPPDWFDYDAKKHVKSKLHDIIKQMIVTRDRKILLGGCWIITDNAIIKKAINARIISLGKSTVLACGNSTVLAHGNSTVTASRKSNVLACGNSTVIAHSNSTVIAHDKSTVTVYGNSTATACGKSTVTAHGNSTVIAYNKSTVTAHGKSNVTACDNSTVTACDKSTVTALGNSTVHDHRKGKSSDD